MSKVSWQYCVWGGGGGLTTAISAIEFQVKHKSNISGCESGRGRISIKSCCVIQINWEHSDIQYCAVQGEVVWEFTGTPAYPAFKKSKKPAPRERRKSCNLRWLVVWGEVFFLFFFHLVTVHLQTCSRGEEKGTDKKLTSGYLEAKSDNLTNALQGQTLPCTVNNVNE